MPGVVTDIAATAGPGIGTGIGAWAVFRFIRWAIEFFYRRADIRSGRLDARELALEKRFNKRLEHVETELTKYRMATMRLVNRIAEIMPQDPVLLEVANILREAIPLSDDIDDDMDRLVRQAKRSGE